MDGDDSWNDDINEDDAFDDEDVDQEDIDVYESDDGLDRPNLEIYDSNLVGLDLGPGSWPSNDDAWERAGKRIGQHNHLNDVTFSDIHNENMEIFFRGFAENRSIQRLRFTECNFFRGELFNVLVSFFENNHNFESLTFWHCCFEGMRLLASALSQFDSLKHFTLGLVERDVNDEVLQLLISEIGGELELLITALSGHSGLREFRLSCTCIDLSSCATLATLLRNPESSLVQLYLSHDRMDDEGAALLATGLAENSTLKELVLNTIRDITEVGWKAFFSVLRSQYCRLEKVNMTANRSINGTAALSLAYALANNRSLGSLDLSFNDEITAVGWQAIFAALESHHALKTLSLKGIALVGADRALAAVVQSPESALTKLCLTYTPIDDATVISLANSLITSNNLTELIIDTSNVNSYGWSAFSQALCNPASIMSTFESNHRLQRLGELYYEEQLPENIRSFLRLNREHGKSQAARLKIIETHFCTGFALPPFVDMDLPVLPHAIAWMSKSSESGRIYEHFYRFLRITTSWFDCVGSQVKREAKKQKIHH